MKMVTDKISIDELKQMSQKMFGGLVKAVVDIEKQIMAVDAEMHVDLEEILLESESEQSNLWGINLHPSKINTDDFVEFDSMINIRPIDNNNSRYVESPMIQKKIVELINKLVQK